MISVQAWEIFFFNNFGILINDLVDLVVFRKRYTIYGVVTNVLNIWYPKIKFQTKSTGSAIKDQSCTIADGNLLKF